jgi:TNF receptor-associated factor 5
MSYQGHYPPPNTPASDYSLSPRVSRRLPRSQMTPDRPASLNIAHPVDLRALVYVGTVDQNLICAICRCALVDPVTTHCGHTFCQSCINDALSHSKLCPVDRSRLSSGDLSPSPRIIVNQLDDLKAKCPSCGTPYARSMLENHLERYCKDALVLCPGKPTEQRCEETVKRKMSDKGCLHYTTECPDCQESLMMVNMEHHREKSCDGRNRHCEGCDAELLRCKESEHEKECPDVIAPCKWMEYGCQHEAKRKDLHFHADECGYKLVGPMAEMLKKEINTLRSEVRTLSETNQLQERRIKFLENGFKDPYRPLDYSDFSDQTLSAIPEAANPEPFSAGNEYLLSLLEAQESKMSQLSAAMTENEAKQTTLLFNETIPIKNELAEIRSMQQTTSMHVRWLLRFRLQDNHRRLGSGPGSNGGSDGGGTSGDSPLPRRLSDGLSRDIITKL